MSPLSMPTARSHKTTMWTEFLSTNLYSFGIRALWRDSLLCELCEETWALLRVYVCKETASRSRCWHCIQNQCCVCVRPRWVLLDQDVTVYRTNVMLLSAQAESAPWSKCWHCTQNQCRVIVSPRKVTVLAFWLQYLEKNYHHHVRCVDGHGSASYTITTVSY